MDLQNFIEKSNFDKKEHYIVDACLNIASSALGCSENEVNKIKENFLKQIELQFYSINAIHHNHFHKINQKDTISPKFNELIVKIADTLVKDCDKKTTEISDILHWHDKNYNIPFDCNEGLIDRYKAELKAELNDIGDLEIVVRDEKGQNANNNINKSLKFISFFGRVN